MRQYRGLTKDGNKWVYGWYFCMGECPYIMTFPKDEGGGEISQLQLEVIPESVGQFVKVINGKEIWEGDLLTGHRLPRRDPFVVEWDESIAGFRMPYSYNEKELEVIGNKTESPELMEQGNG